jgi:hypothetical protein
VNDFIAAEAIYFGALDKQTAQERAAYLDEACGADKALREQVERLLAAQPRTGSFLKNPALAPAATIDEAPIAERPGTVIGPYKLLQQIGEGGWVSSSWRSKRSPFSARSLSRSSNPAWIQPRSLPASRPNGRPWP